MLTIKLHKDSIRDALDKAVGLLDAGGIIAYPTETFYGLGVKFDMAGPLERLYELKKRPAEKAMPLIIGRRDLLPEVASGDWLAALPPAAQALMDGFWPGPLTLLCPAKEGLPEFLTAGTGMIAVRIPGDSFALLLAKEAGFPFTSTSANLSGFSPAVNARQVVRHFEEGLNLLIDGGQTPGGMPSTIIDASDAAIRLVREGAIQWEKIERHLARSSAVQRTGNH